ncbi:MAG: 6-phosphogluconolactonase [Gemmatimonadota bacterium]
MTGVPLRWVAEDHEASCRRAARMIADAAAPVAGRDAFTLVLSGGSAPRRLFELLAEGFPAPLPWELVHVFWCDERCVPPDHPESNYGAARTLLLDHVPIPPGGVHRMRGELGPERGAEAYREELTALSPAGPPAFDLALLGLGDDGHTCSLFPGSPALGSPRAVEPARSPRGIAGRITLTPAGLAGAQRVMFLVAGEGKAEAVAQTLEGERPAGEVPARAIRPRGEVVWLLDAAAAADLSG